MIRQINPKVDLEKLFFFSPRKKSVVKESRIHKSKVYAVAAASEEEGGG